MGWREKKKKKKRMSIEPRKIRNFMFHDEVEDERFPFKVEEQRLGRVVLGIQLLEVSIMWVP